MFIEACEQKNCLVAHVYKARILIVLSLNLNLETAAVICLLVCVFVIKHFSQKLLLRTGWFSCAYVT
jgi:hypothetical protein